MVFLLGCNRSAISSVAIVKEKECLEDIFFKPKLVFSGDLLAPAKSIRDAFDKSCCTNVLTAVQQLPSTSLVLVCSLSELKTQKVPCFLSDEQNSHIITEALKISMLQLAQQKIDCNKNIIPAGRHVLIYSAEDVTLESFLIEEPDKFIESLWKKLSSSRIDN